MLNDAIKIISIVFILELARKIDCEIFSSIDRLEKLASDESTLLKELKMFANQVKNSFVNRKLKDWQDEHELVEKDVMHFITNPLNAFLMIKRATSDVKLIEQKFPEQLKEFLENTKDLRPGDFDLNGAVEGLLRLQTMYKLKSDDFANGIIDGQKTRNLLSVHDLFVIGEEAYRMVDQDYFAVEYLEMVWKKVNEGHGHTEEIDEIVLLIYLVTCYSRTGYFEKAISYINILVEKNPDSSEFAALKKQLLTNEEKFGTSKRSMVDPFSDYYVKDGSFQVYKEMIIYSQVCRGNLTKSQAERSKLYCRYVSDNPFTKLARFRVQEVNLEPYIVVFIDVVSNDEIDFLKSQAKSKVQRAEIALSGQPTEKNMDRVAQNAWHLDSEHAIFSRISRRIEDMTGLTQETAEPLQVQNYGIGGHYSPHWDHVIKRHIQFDGPGNRIATVLLYLSDVEKGGATAFPYLKLLIDVQKGSAAFWYNLKPSGQGDYETRHAGCPVLLGSKWVANKWIREHGQEFRRPCVPENFVEDYEEIFHRGLI